MKTVLATRPYPRRRQTVCLEVKSCLKNSQRQTRKPAKCLMKSLSGLPCWSSGQEPTFQCWGYGFDPWSGKMPCATRQLRPCTTVTDSRAPLGPGLHSVRSHRNGKPALCSWRPAPARSSWHSPKYVSPRRTSQASKSGDYEY